MIHSDSLNTRICKYCQQRCKLSIYLGRVTGVGTLNNFFLFWTTFYSTLKRRLRAFHFPERSTNGNILPTKNLSDETIHWINRALNDICRQLKNWQTIKERDKTTRLIISPKNAICQAWEELIAKPLVEPACATISTTAAISSKWKRP